MDICTVAILAGVFTAAPAAAGQAGSKAAAVIWKRSRTWALKARKPGGQKGEKVKIQMTLTGRLKGRVAQIRADLSARVGQKLCRLQFQGALLKGSYSFVNHMAVVGGQLKVALSRATCKLPDDARTRFKIPTVPLNMFLIKGRLCPGLGTRPMTQKDCLKPGK